MEIEKKWLVDKAKVADLLLKGYYARRERLEQYYLNTMDDEWLIRFRREANGCVLTLKSKGLLSRQELEYPIPPILFEESIKHAKTSLKKYRYTIPFDMANGLSFQIDVYDDYDFITCEVEFPNEEMANSFTPPEWCTQDVTEDRKYKNINLAK